MVHLLVLLLDALVFINVSCFRRQLPATSSSTTCIDSLFVDRCYLFHFFSLFYSILFLFMKSSN